MTESPVSRQDPSLHFVSIRMTQKKAKAQIVTLAFLFEMGFQDYKEFQHCSIEEYVSDPFSTLPSSPAKTITPWASAVVVAGAAEDHSVANHFCLVQCAHTCFK